MWNVLRPSLPCTCHPSSSPGKTTVFSTTNRLIWLELIFPRIQIMFSKERDVHFQCSHSSDCPMHFIRASVNSSHASNRVDCYRSHVNMSLNPSQQPPKLGTILIRGAAQRRPKSGFLLGSSRTYSRDSVSGKNSSASPWLSSKKSIFFHAGAIICFSYCHWGHHIVL